HYAKGTPSRIKSAPTVCKYTVSGSISLPCSGFFSPFPHGTSSLSVSQEYLALPDGAGRFPQGVSDPAVLRILLGYRCLRLRDFHTLWFWLSNQILLHLHNATSQSYNPNDAVT